MSTEPRPDPLHAGSTAGVAAAGTVPVAPGTSVSPGDGGVDTW